jgi:hypothetical protein
MAGGNERLPLVLLQQVRQRAELPHGYPQDSLLVLWGRRDFPSSLRPEKRILRPRADHLARVAGRWIELGARSL